MISAPPFPVHSTVTRWVPGFWPLFLGAANFGFLPASRVTSWYRTRSDNLRVGGSRDSQHLIGTAFDLVPAPGEKERQASRFRNRGFRVAVELHHIHVQAFRAGTPRSSGLLGAVGL